MLLSRDLIAGLKRFTEPTLDTSGLAAWAMQQYAAIELGQVAIEPAQREQVLRVLDELMFADQEPFALADADIRQLIDQLTKP